MILEWKEVEGGANGMIFSSVPESAGVYIISTKQKSDGKYAVNYVGRADDLRHRLQTHFSENGHSKELLDHIQKNYGMKVSYALVSNYKDREGIELFLYNELEPNLNKVTPYADYEISCNLPNVRKYYHPF